MAGANSDGARSPEQAADLNENEHALLELLRKVRQNPPPDFQAAVLGLADRVDKLAAAHPDDAATRRFADAFRRYIEAAVIEAQWGVQ